MAKTSLCLSCGQGVVREWDCGVENCEENRHFQIKCLPGNDYPIQPVTACNYHSKSKRKVTFHDPDFDGYAKGLEEGK